MLNDGIGCQAANTDRNIQCAGVWPEKLSDTVRIRKCNSWCAVFLVCTNFLFFFFNLPNGGVNINAAYAEWILLLLLVSAERESASNLLVLDYNIESVEWIKHNCCNRHFDVIVTLCDNAFDYITLYQHQVWTKKKTRVRPYARTHWTVSFSVT